MITPSQQHVPIEKMERNTSTFCYPCSTKITRAVCAGTGQSVLGLLLTPADLDCLTTQTHCAVPDCIIRKTSPCLNFPRKATMPAPTSVPTRTSCRTVTCPRSSPAATSRHQIPNQRFPPVRPPMVEFIYPRSSSNGPTLIPS